MKSEEQIYNYIKEIADEQFNKREKISRTDVAYILRVKYKVNYEDGSLLSNTIYQAYLQLGKPESIHWAITSNNENNSIIDQYELDAQLEEGNTQAVISIVNNNLNATQESILEAKQEVSNVLTLRLAQDAASLYKWLQGTDTIDAIRTKGSSLMMNYGKMVDSYLTAENCVKNDVHDFVEIRTAIHSTYMNYAMALVDIFGDSIKVIAPQLFDYNAIKWLDVDNLQKQKQLEFNKLDEKCTLVIGEIAEHFSNTVDKIPVWMKMNKAIGSKGGLYGSLVMGVMSYVNHWLDAQQKTVQIQKEYVQFEDSVKRDRFLISTDMTRLATIHKTMNDLYIPRANAFLRYGDQLLASDFNQLIESIYTNKTRLLKEDRDKLLCRIAELERSINDHNENIALFDAQINEWQGMLDAQKKNYQNAVSQKPKEPNTLTRFLTFGFASKNYGRKFLEWDEKNGQLVDAYEETILGVKESTEDRDSHNKQLEEDKKEYEECKQLLNIINQKIKAELSCSSQQKLEALKHLKDVISLLQAGKKIMESKLDESLLSCKEIPNSDNFITLPTEIEKNIHNFCGEVCSEIKENGGTIAASILNELGLSKEDITKDMADQTQIAIQKASELIQDCTYLQTMHFKSQLSDAIYEQELAHIKEDFKSAMKDIDQKGSVVLEALKRANTAVNNDDLRQALIDLAGLPTTQLSEADFEAILKGEKTLEI